MISINTNEAATLAAYNLTNTSASLKKSLERLSSGSRINSSSDDAGGLAVSMKLTSSLRRTISTQSNVGNALSFLETQDSALKTADKVVSRISELTQLATDVTKSTSDLALYQTEVNNLKEQLGSMLSESFNGINLFAGAATAIPSTTTTMSVVVSQDGSQTIGITQSNLASIGFLIGTSNSTSVGIDISSVTSAQGSIATVNEAIQNLAQLRAYNGSEQSRLNFALDLLSVNRSNLEAANSRIVDVDLATESANLAKWNILQQSGVSMLAQANASKEALLRLLQ